MRRTILLGCLSVLLLPVQAQEFEKAQDAVNNMRVGWNLGNTLDAHSGKTTNMWIERWTGRKTSDYETAWGQPVTEPELFVMLKEAGFNAIRVPVTWYPHMGLKTNANSLVWDKEKNPLGMKVDDAWMKRVHEVVDYVVSQGMYCILNVHHDTGASDVAWVVADKSSFEENKVRYDSLWTQIANEFRDYDSLLLFESYNEILDPLGSWGYPSSKSEGGYDKKIATSAYDAVNSFAQTFVNAVRATGGNNRTRNLVINDYAASSCAGSGDHDKEPFTSLVIPDDPEDPDKEHLILEVHHYIYLDNISGAKTQANNLLNDYRERFVWNGIPVIIGEWGTLDSDEIDVQTDSRYSQFLDYCKYFVQQAKKKKIATFYWMGLSDKKSRSVPEWSQPDLKDAIITGYYGKNGYVAGVESNVTDSRSSYADYWLPGGIVIRNGRKYFVR
ncbi:MAG: glycoside hydrolase family 5 protein [Bacteroidaceae bacterium]|nr:glycoside hydrolase family 5 protein [Bacteroidaceae bacterium]